MRRTLTVIGNEADGLGNLYAVCQANDNASKRYIVTRKVLQAISIDRNQYFESRWTYWRSGAILATIFIFWKIIKHKLKQVAFRLYTLHECTSPLKINYRLAMILSLSLRSFVADASLTA